MFGFSCIKTSLRNSSNTFWLLLVFQTAINLLAEVLQELTRCNIIMYSFVVYHFFVKSNHSSTSWLRHRQAWYDRLSYRHSFGRTLRTFAFTLLVATYLGGKRFRSPKRDHSFEFWPSDNRQEHATLASTNHQSGQNLKIPQTVAISPTIYMSPL